MEFAVLFLIGYLIAQAGKENEQEALPRPKEPEGRYHHPHELMRYRGTYTWHTHYYEEGRGGHWHPQGMPPETVVYCDDTPNPDDPIVIDSKEE